jgi:hypothetical protein
MRSPSRWITPQRVDLLVGRVGAPQQVLGVPDDRGDRGPQLVAGVGREAALGLERLLQPVEHVVDRDASARSSSSVAGTGTRRAGPCPTPGGRLRHALHRRQHLPRQPPHAEGERQEGHQDGQAEVARELLERGLHVGGRQAHQDDGRERHLLVGERDRPERAEHPQALLVGERHVARQLVPVDQLLERPVGQEREQAVAGGVGAHAGRLGVVDPLRMPATSRGTPAPSPPARFDNTRRRAAAAARWRWRPGEVGQRLPRALLDRGVERALGQQVHRHRHRRQDDGDEGAGEDREAQAQGHATHRHGVPTGRRPWGARHSSRSTYPTPRTVWIRRRSPSPSSLRRR